MNPLPWLFGFAFGCHHRHLSRVFTIKKRTYQVCVKCGGEFEYSIGSSSKMRTPVFVAWLWFRPTNSTLVAIAVG
jgi:hypothetical protein